MFTHDRVFVWFRSIKHYFLMDQGDFIVQFMDMAEEEMRKGMDEVRSDECKQETFEL